MKQNEAIIFNRLDLEINAPAAKVWAVNLDRPTYEVSNNRRNQLGEKSRFFVPDAQGDPLLWFSNEIVAFLEGKMIAHKVVPAINPNNDLVVYNAEVIPRDDNSTLLRMTIFMRTELGGDEALGEDELLRLKLEREAQSQAVYEQRFADLKTLIEADQ